ncbi:ABC transporter ATP-binding protein [Candidatus Saccharibacteria bacterium oral taxon 488]|nr:ABC transporter ATP-binding protein [Candidatus Saccharibacteria bacterium oral taxon 488]
MKPEVGRARDEDIAAFLAKFDDVEEAIDAIRNFAQPAVSAGLVDLPPAAKSDSAAKVMTPSAAAPECSGRCHIAVTDLAKSYRVGRQTIPALGGVSLDIFAGEFVAITGASGSGKSTLLQLIGGLDKPSAGQILINDQPLSRLSDRQLSRFRSREIGFVFQSFYLQPFLTLSANLEIPAMFARVKPKQRRARAQELAELVGLADRMHHLPRELSGGQIQRAAIARALFNRPNILLADEPTGNLDSANSDRIIDLFHQIRRELGTTVVIVTHNPDIAAAADREIRLKDGRVTDA